MKRGLTLLSQFCALSWLRSARLALPRNANPSLVFLDKLKDSIGGRVRDPTAQGPVSLSLAG